jgi:hypothetical protein
MNGRPTMTHCHAGNNLYEKEKNTLFRWHVPLNYQSHTTTAFPSVLMKEAFPTNVSFLVLHSMDCLIPFVRKEYWPPRTIIIFLYNNNGGNRTSSSPWTIRGKPCLAYIWLLIYRFILFLHLRSGFSSLFII